MPRHGGNLEKLARDQGLDGDKLIDFSANINPLGMDESLKELIRDNLHILQAYPDFEYKNLKGALASKYGLDEDFITVGNGAEEIISNYVLMKRPKIILIEPTFSEYRAAGVKAGCQIYTFLLKGEGGFALDLDQLQAWLDGLDDGPYSLFLCNPNNPTGILYSLDQVQDLARILADRGINLILDESFIDFTGQESFFSLLEDHPQILVIRSLTKFYAIPGLRLGFAASSDKVLIGDMEVFRNDWAVNSLADLCGQALEDLEDYEARTRAYVDKERKALKAAIDSLEKITYIGGSANFIMIRTQVSDFYQLMLARGLVVRKCGNFMGLDETYFRLAVRTREENTLMVQALREVDKI